MIGISRAKFIERFNEAKRKINTFVELLNPDCVTCSNSAALDRQFIGY